MITIQGTNYHASAIQMSRKDAVASSNSMTASTASTPHLMTDQITSRG
jgi:hypothetical protein